jgi:hypothetical protein
MWQVLLQKNSKQAFNILFKNLFCENDVGGELNYDIFDVL